VVGAIDVLWQDSAGEWWVGDYKFAEAEPDSGERHHAQLSIYALAVAAALGVEGVRGKLWYIDEGGGGDLAWDRAGLVEIERRVVDAFARLGPHDPEPAFPTEDP